MTGNLLFDRIIMGLALFMTLSAGGLFVYTEMMYKKKLPDNSEEAIGLTADAKKVVIPKAFNIDKVIVNLENNSQRLRFLDLGLSFVTFKEDQVAFLEQHKPLIHDIIILTASQMKAEDLNSITGRILLEERIKNNIHGKLGDDIIKEILFPRYVVQ